MICKKEGSVKVDDKIVSCKQIRSELRTNRRKYRIVLKAMKASTLKRRLEKCTSTGKVIVVKKKPCSCTKRRVLKWRRQLRVTLRQKRRLRNKVILSRKIQEIKESRKALKECTKCSDEKKAELKADYLKAKSNYLRTKRIILKKDKIILKKRLSVWRPRAKLCKESKTVLIDEKTVGCKKVLNKFRRIKLQRRANRHASQRVKLQYRIVRCKKTGKLIKIKTSDGVIPSPCTKERLRSWRLRARRALRRQRRAVTMTRILKIRSSRVRALVWAERKKACKADNKYVLVRDRKVTCEKVNKRLRKNLRIIRSVRTRIVRSARRQLRKSERRLEAKCEKKSDKSYVAKDGKTRCNRLARRTRVRAERLEVAKLKRSISIKRARVLKCINEENIIIQADHLKISVPCDEK